MLGASIVRTNAQLRPLVEGLIFFKSGADVRPHAGALSANPRISRDFWRLMDMGGTAMLHFRVEQVEYGRWQLTDGDASCWRARTTWRGKAAGWRLPSWVKAPLRRLRGRTSR